ncbi:hypothetical protein Btru_074837 [Bulinus truncatus]|nr:hypothetical protein Btru_074837 [Bulinus truncatus]
MTSTIQTRNSIEQLQLGSENISFLTSIGVTVLFETDACELHCHAVVNQKNYQRIIFNFPLADRHNIKKNRALLGDFFASCGQILTDEGLIYVTLCKGQGGTPADQPLRSWHDSWQILAMAANAGFLLASVVAFDISCFPGYHSTGFRFQDKSFNTEGALTHIFEKSDTVVVQDNKPLRGHFTCGDNSYTCSQYLVEKMNMNLLNKKDHPLCIVRKRLEKSFTFNMKANIVPDTSSWKVLPGHTSGVFIYNDPNKETLGRETADMVKDGAVEKKDRKNEANMCLMTKNSLLKHGLDEHFGAKSSPSDSLPIEQCLHECMIGSPDAVYVLLKNCKPQEVVHLNSNIDTVDPSIDRACIEESTVLIGSMADLNQCSEFTCGDGTEKLCQIYHFRTSLLEHLSQVLSELDEGKAQTDYGSVTHPSISTGIVYSGQCSYRCPIQPNTLPSHHEMVTVFKISCPREPEQRDHEIKSDTLDNYKSLISSVYLSLQGSGLFANHNIHVEEYRSSETIKINGIDSISCIHIITLESPQSDSRQEINKPKAVGFIFKANTAQIDYCVTVIKLDALVLSICDIIDPRLLYSQNPKFAVQFQENSFPSKFVPLSLYPMKFVHDLSFWENEDFIESEMHEIIRDIAGDVVVNVVLIDLYTDAGTGKKSRCYRLHFLSHNQVLSYLTSWKLQSLIRLSVAHRQKLTVRTIFLLNIQHTVF